MRLRCLCGARSGTAISRTAYDHSVGPGGDLVPHDPGSDCGTACSAVAGRSQRQRRRATSNRRKLYCDLNNLDVRSFILTGAPLAPDHEIASCSHPLPRNRSPNHGRAALKNILNISTFGVGARNGLRMGTTPRNKPTGRSMVSTSARPRKCSWTRT